MSDVECLFVHAYKTHSQHGGEDSVLLSYTETMITGGQKNVFVPKRIMDISDAICACSLWFIWECMPSGLFLYLRGPNSGNKEEELGGGGVDAQMYQV